ncbi:exonuclease SbcCD subunit D [soil metagenome]|jgi:exonuclease SbcD
MRLLHTADWHLGRGFHGAPLLDQQVTALDALVELVSAESVDVVVIAGDVYDRQIPPADAVAVLSETLARLRSAGAVVVAISGNHDSAARLRFADALLATAGVHMRSDARTAGQPVVVPANDGGPDLAVYPIPYLEPEIARHQLGDPEARTHAQVLHLALDRARTDLAAAGSRRRSVAVAHAFAAGGQPCDSERVLRLGGADRVPLGILGGFDYVALGHLHGRQTFADGRMQYAGSPLPYSFSERQQRKGAWLVDIAADGGLQLEWADLPAGRPLACVRGPLDQLLTSRTWTAAERCWVQAVVTDQVVPRDPMARLRSRFPWAVSLTHEPPVAAGGDAETYRQRVAGRNDLDLVGDFVTHVTGAPLDHQGLVVCASVIDDTAREPAA